jgi:hypothetical protein
LKMQKYIQSPLVLVLSEEYQASPVFLGDYGMFLADKDEERLECRFRQRSKKWHLWSRFDVWWRKLRGLSRTWRRSQSNLAMGLPALASTSQYSTRVGFRQKCFLCVKTTHVWRMLRHHSCLSQNVSVKPRQMCISYGASENSPRMKHDIICDSKGTMNRLWEDPDNVSWNRLKIERNGRTLCTKDPGQTIHWSIVNLPSLARGKPSRHALQSTQQWTCVHRRWCIHWRASSILRSWMNSSKKFRRREVYHQCRSGIRRLRSGILEAGKGLGMLGR